MINQCIVVNSSVIIALAETNLLDILVSLYRKILVSKAVYDEVVVRGSGRPGSHELEELVRQGRVLVITPEDRALVEALHDPLGLGEAEAIALAIEQDCIVALDDRVARSKARAMGLKVIGTLGLLREAYDKNLVDKNTLVQTLRQLKQHGFRISDIIIREVIEKLD